MGDMADDAFDRELEYKIRLEENWKYICSLSDEELISTANWHLDKMVEKEFGELQFKSLVKGIVKYWNRYKKLSDAQRLSLQIGLSKIDENDPYL